MIEMVTDPLIGEGCIIQPPEPIFGGVDSPESNSSSIDFDFDGANLSLVANDGLTPECSIGFSASVARFGTEQVLFGLNAFDVTVQGQPLIQGQPVRFAPLQLSRVRTPRPIACEAMPTSLIGLNWNLSNTNLAIFPSLPLGTDQVVVTAFGSDETFSSIDLSGGNVGPCVGAGGTFSFDGTQLVFESGFAGFEPFPFPDDPFCNDTCEFVFDGQCDDGREGSATAICPSGSDCSDCGYFEDPGCNDYCQFAFDGKCDDGREGAASDFCRSGSDCFDCGPILGSIFEFTGCDDSCEFVFDGQCDDGREGAASDLCISGTDCSDCGTVTTTTKSLTIVEHQTGGNGDGEPPILEIPPSCSISFTGTVADCGVYLPPIIGLDPATQVIRIEGTGTYTDGERSGEFTTVYLSIDQGGGGICGVAMIPTMPIIFLGLCGFRLISRRRAP